MAIRRRNFFKTKSSRSFSLTKISMTAPVPGRVADPETKKTSGDSPGSSDSLWCSARGTMPRLIRSRQTWHGVPEKSTGASVSLPVARSQRFRRGLSSAHETKRLCPLQRTRRSGPDGQLGRAFPACRAPICSAPGPPPVPRVRAGRGDDRPAAAGDAGGALQRARPVRAVSGADRRARPPWAGAPCGARDESRCARHRGQPRRRAPGAGVARAATRNSRADQGQRRHGGPDGHDGRVPRPGGREAAARGVRRGAAPGRGRRHPRENQPQRVGKLPLEPFLERLERPRRAVPEPVRPRPQSLRLELGVGCRGCGELLRRRGRYGDRWVDRLPRGRALPGRHQADRRAREPRGHHPDRAQSRHGRPHGPHRP